MPPVDGTLKHAFESFTRFQTSSSSPGNRYENVDVSGNSSAVVGNVVHQHFYSPANSSATALRNGKDQAVELRTQGFSELLLNTISKYDHQHAHWLRAHPRIPGTCEWIMELPTFMDWAMEKSPPILVCIGSMGCGKSVTASAVIDWLNTAKFATGSPILSYYVDATRIQPPTTSEILRAFVKQIVIHYKDVDTPFPAGLHSKIKATLSSITSMTTTVLNLTSIMKEFLRLISSCFIVVDGIDALPESEIMAFVNVLRQVWNPQPGSIPFGRLIMFCRETLGRRIRLDSIPASVVLQIKLKHLKSDIHAYVDNQVDAKQQEYPVTSDEVLLGEIKYALKLKSEKMFLWVHLQILSLWDPGITTCDQDIRDQLENLPEGLDAIYTRCLRRISTTNDRRSQVIAPRMFRWLACTLVPLTPIQAREAVSMTPDNLPLQRSQLLSLPVTDYCANLVVLDDLTGSIIFAHPSVKDFLSDAEKVPIELRHLSLVDVDDSWCGKVCLAHAKLHNSREGVVVFRPTEIEPKIASPIIKNILATVSPLKFMSYPSTSKREFFQMPLSAVSKRSASSVADSHLHDYICHHWLQHNPGIQEDHPNYIDFENLCLTHDPDLQPWATTQLTNIDHYRRMVMHAVMINHGPLLKVAQKMIDAKGRDYRCGVFDRFAPGTDSTYLHCAALLGHTDVMRVLLEIPGNHGHLADSQWTSAAASAMQAQQMEAFELLIRGYPGTFVTEWSIRMPRLEQRTHCRSGRIAAEERLLDLCTIHGNSRGVQVLLSAAGASFGSDDLSSAFFLACKHGQQDIGKLLARQNADVRNFEWTERKGVHGTSWIQKDRRRSASWVALELRDLTMLRTLLEIRQTVGVETEDLDILQVVDSIGGQCKDWRPFIALMQEFNVDVSGWHKNHGMFCLLDSLFARVGRGSITYREVDYLVRMVLPSFCADFEDFDDAAARQKHQRTPTFVRWGLFMNWLKNGTDDVLVPVVNTGWMSRLFFTTDCLDAVIGRCSSRVLECIFNLACRLENCDPRFEGELGLWITKEMVEVLKQRHSMDALNPKYLHSYVGLGQAPIMEFLLCSELQRRGAWYLDQHMSKLNARRIYHTIADYDNDRQRPQYPVLMWVRCYYQTNGDIPATRSLCHDLHCIGADGNFALNFPAGYVRHQDSTLRGYQWGISPSIWLAIHRWSFRLNRARNLRFSESDMWYMARVLTTWVGRSTAA